MTYNIHPIIVHFPIALLFLYSIIKILPFRKWFPKVAWRQIEIVLLTIGVLGAFVALSTGETAQHLTKNNRQLIRVHSTFASIATWLYGLLLLGEILTWLTPSIIPKLKMPWLTSLLTYIQKIITSITFLRIIAFLALIAISITGLLGGVIVYGATADPLAGIVLRLFGLNF